MVGNVSIGRSSRLTIIAPIVIAFLGLGLVHMVLSAAAQQPGPADSHARPALDHLRDPETLTTIASPANIVGETGHVTLSDSLDGGHWQTVTLATEYADPVVVAFVNSRNDNDSIDVRVSDVTSTTFRLFMQEPDNSPHPAPELVSYIVMEKGRHTLDGGLVAEAGSVDTDLVHREGQSFGGVFVPFVLPFAQQPIVLNTLNTFENRDFMSSLARAVSPNGFTAQLEAAGSGSPVQIETIGWIAFSKGVGLTGGNAYEIGRAADGLPDGVDDGTPQVITFTSFTTAPDVVVKPNSVSGTDGSWSRGAGINTNITQTVFAEEDQVGDPERNHLSTSFAWAAFEPNTLFRSACFVEADGDAALDFSSVDNQALQDAHDAANSGATLKVAGICAGVVTTAGMSQTVLLTKSLSLQGGYTPTNWLAPADPETFPVILDAKGGGYVVNISQTNVITLDGLTIQGGDAVYGGDDESEGGGIYMDGDGLLTVANSILQYNTAEIGGAIYSGAGAGVVITGSQIVSNTADNLGAGFYSREGWADVFNTLLKGNVAGKGGALYNTHGNVMTVISSTIDNNAALLAGGGGIYNGFAALLVLNDSLVIDNWSGMFGGGIINDGAFLNASNSNLIDNHADFGGGALFNNGAHLANFTGVNFTGNTAANNGGAILNQAGSPLVLTQCFVDENGTTTASANVGGGAIYNSTSGVITISQSSVDSNTTRGDGGAIYNNASGVITITQSTVDSNLTHGDGGAVFNELSGVIAISQSTVDNNTAQGDGGAAYNDEGLLTIADSQLNGNEAAIGGAIYNLIQSTQVASSVISGNMAVLGAGALFNASGGYVTLDRSTISGNTATDGGGIVTLAGAIHLSASTMAGNMATEDGGAVFVIEVGAVFTASNSTLSGNTAGAGAGGAMYNSGGTAALINSTLSDNAAGGPGGGIYTDLDGGATSVINTIIANSLSGGDCAVSSPGVVLDNGHNLVEDGSCLTAGTSQSGDPGLGPLADNGGGRLTYGLLLQSPARDAGRNGACASDPINNLDQRGQPRPLDGDGDGLAICDVGAVEMEAMTRVFLPMILR